MGVLTRTAAAFVAVWFASATAQPPFPAPDAGEAQVPALRGTIHRVLSKAQDCAKRADFECARRQIEQVRAREDLSPYERAIAAQFSAFVNHEQGSTGAAIEDYERLLAQPGLPERLVHDTLYTMSQLHLEEGEPEAALTRLDQWFALTDDASSQAHLLKSQIHYKLEQWAEGATEIHAAMRIAEDAGEQIREGWHQLAFVFAYELGGCARAIDELERLMQRWPKRDYYVQASGCAGQLGETERQLELMDIAAAAGLLDASASFMHARMLMSAERYEDAKRALERGTRLIDVKGGARVRDQAEEAAERIGTGHYGAAARALAQASRALRQLGTARTAP